MSGGRPSGSGSRSAKRRTGTRNRKLLPFDAARYLTDDDAVAEYMNAVRTRGSAARASTRR
jgi:hypothetical protein